MIAPLDEYRAFLEAKRVQAQAWGVGVLDATVVHPIAKPHQRDIVRWAVEGGRRAIFSAFGLGKTIMGLETVRLTLARAGGMALVVAPLGVRMEFFRDAEKLGLPIRFIRTTEELDGDGIYLTNYESVREGKIDVSRFTVVHLDEAAILRGFGGTKTFREFMRIFEATPYRFVATATPSPNDYIELLAYAAFLGIMDVGEAKTRFFKRNSEKADELTIHPHKEEEFWLWVHSWAVFLQRPSDLGYSDEGYDLPPIDVRWHMVESDALPATEDSRGQFGVMGDDALGLVGAAAVKRRSMPARLAKVAELLDERPDDHVVLWHDLEDERRGLERIPGVVSVYGSQDLDEREASIGAFADGKIARLAGKPVMLGSGTNLQRHCHWAVFVGIGFKFSDFIQAIHRIYRFLQHHQVRIDIVYAAAESSVRKVLEAKWAQHNEQMALMTGIIRQYGLNSLATHDKLARSIGVTRREESGDDWLAVLNDTVDETAAMEADSQGLIVTSIPFGTQYEYTPSYNDFGHTDDDQHFWRQMDYLSPHLYRTLMPGRVMAVHVKDRIRPGGMDGLGFQTVSPFHADAIHHYRKHGFAYVGLITIATDVVRENSQTYRLGWTEQCKDGSRMAVGMPEYVLLFRKPPTDRSDGYADVRVVKDKVEYSRARWQFDAHAVWRSSGERLLSAEDLIGLEAHQVFKLFKLHSGTTVYDHEHTVALAASMDARKRLPPGFMLLQPVSTNPDVWTDVTRMRTLNGVQQAKGKEMHLCPLQFDIVDRLINRFSNPGEWVFDPFAGLMTVPLRAVALGRRGRGHELNAGYFDDGVWHMRAADEKRSAPSLFDLVGVDEEVPV